MLNIMLERNVNLLLSFEKLHGLFHLFIISMWPQLETSVEFKVVLDNKISVDRCSRLFVVDGDVGNGHVVDSRWKMQKISSKIDPR